MKEKIEGLRSLVESLRKQAIWDQGSLSRPTFIVGEPCAMSVQRLGEKFFVSKGFIGEEPMKFMGATLAGRFIHVQFEVEVDGHKAMAQVSLEMALERISGFRAYVEHAVMCEEDRDRELIRDSVNILENDAHTQAMLATRAGENALFGSW